MSSEASAPAYTYTHAPYAYAGAPLPLEQRGFNAGVFVFNLKRWYMDA